MAVKKVLNKKDNVELNQEDVIVVDGEENDVVITPDEDSDVLVDTEPEVTLVENVNKPIEPKNVKIKMKQDHRCNIGGEWYYLSKGSTHTVPENVKNVLVEADLLLPL